MLLNVGYIVDNIDPSYQDEKRGVSRNPSCG